MMQYCTQYEKLIPKNQNSLKKKTQKQEAHTDWKVDTNPRLHTTFVIKKLPPASHWSTLTAATGIPEVQLCIVQQPKYRMIS